MNRCASCGFPVCSGTSPKPDAILLDGTPLYLKNGKNPAGANLQMQLYAMLANGGQKRKE